MSVSQNHSVPGLVHTPHRPHPSSAPATHVSALPLLRSSAAPALFRSSTYSSIIADKYRKFSLIPINTNVSDNLSSPISSSLLPLRHLNIPGTKPHHYIMFLLMAFLRLIFMTFCRNGKGAQTFKPLPNSRVRQSTPSGKFR